ncbi:hypothetical protein HMI01_18360 [Halolactibacillus miurensis]|uniref:Uncharacterized protein n=1 Tax=Halolactibacillus miurensis TaxID=306541 RepID=A0A1I6TYQ9_9BACI|nr:MULTISPECIES: hypothetical protein [Halolactibacillus]GEM04848.1 hypothetical protein HMI01_18360 [Halolactibacillus miurensis]SFS94228.1 hypothetical protein SAMN05421668_11944 [Halolactibacillus miurensis]
MNPVVDMVITVVLGFIFFIVISSIFGGEPQAESFFLAVIVGHLFNDKYQLATRFTNFWT